MARLNASDKLEALRKKQKELEAQIRATEARTRETTRKEDTRRKIVAGALVLEHFERNPETPFSREFRELLARGVEQRNRTLFAFLPQEAASEKTATAKTPPQDRGNAKASKMNGVPSEGGETESHIAKAPATELQSASAE